MNVNCFIYKMKCNINIGDYKNIHSLKNIKILNLTFLCNELNKEFN